MERDRTQLFKLECTQSIFIIVIYCFMVTPVVLRFGGGKASHRHSSCKSPRLRGTSGFTPVWFLYVLALGFSLQKLPCAFLTWKIGTAGMMSKREGVGRKQPSLLPDARYWVHGQSMTFSSLWLFIWKALVNLFIVFWLVVTLEKETHLGSRACYKSLRWK